MQKPLSTGPGPEGVLGGCHVHPQGLGVQLLSLVSIPTLLSSADGFLYQLTSH